MTASFSSRELAQLRKSKPIVKARDKDRCIVCGEPSVNIHHVVPRLKSHDSSPKNLVCLCHLHHQIAHGDIRAFIYDGDSRKTWNRNQRLIGFAFSTYKEGCSSVRQHKKYLRVFNEAIREALNYQNAVLRTTGKYTPVLMYHNPDYQIHALLVGRFTPEERIKALTKCVALSKHEALPETLARSGQYFRLLEPFPSWSKLIDFVFAPLEGSA